MWFFVNLDGCFPFSVSDSRISDVAMLIQREEFKVYVVMYYFTAKNSNSQVMYERKQKAAVTAAAEGICIW